MQSETDIQMSNQASFLNLFGNNRLPNNPNELAVLISGLMNS